MGFPVVYSGLFVTVIVSILSMIESLARSIFFSFFFATSLCANNFQEMEMEEDDDPSPPTSLSFHLASFSSSPWPLCHPLVIPFHHDDDEIELGQCSVCLEDLKEEVGKLEGCGHVFHMPCIGEWIHTHAHLTCPLCRCSVAC